MPQQYNDIFRGFLAEQHPPKKRKCFISYYHGDQTAVDAFVDAYKDVLIAKAIGVSEEDDYIDSDDPAYVMTRIRELLLGDSSVTICMIGQCTHSRRYVDWELKSSLRQGEYTPNGLLTILLPGMTSGHLPQRVKDNWSQDESKCFGLYRAYPSSSAQLKGWIEDAQARRTSHAHLIANSQDMMKYNAKCRIHTATH